MSTSDVLTSTQDSYINVQSAGSNYGKATGLALLNVSGQFRRTYIYFPLDVVKMDGATVLDATLSLRLKTAWASADLLAKRVLDAWKESTINFTNEPTADATTYTATVSGAAEDRITLDVTDIVQAWVDGSPNYGFRLTTSATTMRSVYASEAGPFQKPILTVSWKTPPDPPIGLRPSGAQAITAAAPPLLWSHGQPGSASEAVSEFQLQIDNATDFASPVFDSGWVVGSATSYDTATAGSPPSLSNNTTYYWRVRVKDTDGTISEYSDVAEFQRRTFGTLNITAPTTTVAETTPTIAHTFTGRTQTAVEYVLTEDGVEVYRRPKAAQTATDLELPPGVIRSDTATYVVTVRVWDEYARSEPSYVEDTEDFTFVFSSTPAPVTTLAAAHEDGHVLLTWQRSTAPDYFAVLEDDLIIMDRVEISDAALGGTSYALAVYTSSPRVEHTYSVDAVVQNAGVYQHPDDSPTVDFTFRPIGRWLIDMETGDEVHVLGEQGMETNLGETGVTLYPLGRQDPVRITDQVRGLEGACAGDLLTVGSRTAASERAAFLRMKSSPTATRRFVFAWRNIPVVIGESAVSDTPEREEHYLVSFAFFQVGEFEVDSD